MNLKQTVLSELIDNGKVISGEEIAKKSGKSRVAIRKAILSLTEQGFKIEAEQSSGYRLISSPDILTPEYLSLYLPNDLPLKFYETIDSTNSEAKRLLSNGEKAPFVVVAKEQSGGRGRRGRSFSSPEGGLYFSLVLKANEINSVELVTTATALGVAKALEELTGEKVQIKWVNDVYFRGKKAVGILTEGFINMEFAQVEEVVIGVGINYETPTIPDELKDIAISLYPKQDAPHKMVEALGLTIKNIISTLNSDFLPEYKARCFVLGKKINVIKNGESTPAIALDLDEKAHLVVQYENGCVEHLSSGEVSIRF